MATSDDGSRAAIPAPNVSEAEIEELQEIFNLVDTDRGGSISPNEVTELLNTLGIKATQEEVDAMIAEIDENSDGEIDFEEFVAVMSRKLSVYYNADQVKSAFAAFTNSNSKGMIRRKDVMTALTKYGADRLTEEQAADLVKEIDFDDNDEFHFEEHIDMLMN